MLVLPTVTIHHNGNVLGKPVNRGLNILPCDSRCDWLHEAASLQCSVKETFKYGTWVLIVWWQHTRTCTLRMNICARCTFPQLSGAVLTSSNLFKLSQSWGVGASYVIVCVRVEVCLQHVLLRRPRRPFKSRVTYLSSLPQRMYTQKQGPWRTCGHTHRVKRRAIHTGNLIFFLSFSPSIWSCSMLGHRTVERVDLSIVNMWSQQNCKQSVSCIFPCGEWRVNSKMLTKHFSCLSGGLVWNLERSNRKKCYRSTLQTL